MYVIDISKTNSINATAKRVFTSQQTISESVKRLEAELGCIILDRSKTGVNLTEDGKYVLSYAIHTVEQYESLLQHFKNRSSSQPLQGSLSLGVAPMIASILTTDFSLEMHKHHPDITMQIKEYPVDTILDLLICNQLDFGLFASIKNEFPSAQVLDKIASVPLKTLELYIDHLGCVLHKNNPLTIQKNFFTEQETTQFKQTLYFYTTRVENEANYLYISNNVSIHQKFMREENTICLMPYMHFKQLYSNQDFVYIPIVDSAPLTVNLLYSEAHCDNKLHQLFIQLCSSFFQKKQQLLE